MPRKARTIPWLDWRDGWAYVKWFDEQTRQTKRLSLGTKDEDEAQSRFGAFLVEGKAITQPRGNAQLGVSQALDDYLKEHVKDHCAAVYRQQYACDHLKEFFNDTPISDVDIAMSERYTELRRKGVIGMSYRTGKKRSGQDGTIRRELSTLIAAANHARKRKRISVMPSIKLPVGKLLGQDEQAPYYTKPELEALIKAADGELRWIIELLYLTGARRNSIVDLERSQVKWDQKQIILQKPTKRATKKRQPIVPILPAMEAPLKAAWAASEGRERLFVMDGQAFYRRFTSLCSDLGFEDRAHPHVLRHTRATHLLQDGVSLYDVARLLGDTMATIERVYGHHSAHDLARKLGGLNAAQEARGTI